ncbi:MAG: KpsF/GutQ family sugar-phosphate isomerase [Verrucomicrobia bacterium]|nr:MAG: KpsF/GutQ family sugar-phosphate isomerase [Verrucomicrobiota bacterium]
MDILARARSVIEIETDGLQQMAQRLDASFIAAVDLLQAILESRGKIIVVGVGKSGNIGQKIAATLNSTGATAVVMDSQNALHGDLGMINDGDAVILLSYSGETRELLNLLPFIKRFDVRLLAITGRPDSSLAHFCEVVLDTSVAKEACPLNLAPTSSSTAMLVMGDALAMVLLESRGFTENDFARYHPGGSLGRALLTRISDIMRKEALLPMVDLTADVYAALDAMNAARSGACLIVSEDGSLAGIFTHGDFARNFRKDPELGQRLVREVMTQRPITLRDDQLAVEAINTLGKNRIDDIVVINGHGKPVGLIDSQDLARLKLV